MAFLPSLFYHNVKAKNGLAKSNRFQVVLPIPKYIADFVEVSFLEQIVNLPNSIFTDVTSTFRAGASEGVVSRNPLISKYLALQCEAAELPGKALQTVEAQTYGPTYKIPISAQYSETSLTFICTNEFYERKLFDRWLEAIVPTDTNNLRYQKSSLSSYLTNIKIIQYDDFIKQIYAVELVDAFPVSIAAQPLNWSDDGFHKLTVSFSYLKYKTIYKGEYDLAAAIQALLGSSVAGVPVKDILAGQIRGTAEAANEFIKNPFSIF